MGTHAKEVPMRMHRSGWRLLFVVLLASVAPPVTRAGDAPPSVYTGTLGKQNIVMELPQPHSGTIFDARYFYTRHRIDIGLGGNMTANDHLSLEEDRSRNGFDLVRQPDGGWKGTWTPPEGPDLPVSLHPATLPPLPASAPDFLKHARENMPYVYLRLRNMGLVRDKQQSFMGHRLQWWREPGSGIRLFQIEDGYSDDQRQRINRVLMSALWEEVDSYYGCVGGDGAGGDYRLRVKPTFLSASAVSIVKYFNSYCGGAYPTSGRTPINLDAHTGRKLWLDDILWLGKGRPFHYSPIPGEEEDFPANLARLGQWTGHQKQVFVPWLIHQFKRRYPKQMSSSKDQCGYADDPDIWAFSDWYLTSKGIFFIPTFPHVVAACSEMDDWSLLPYSEIRKHPGRLRLTLP
jgi:hypothetical protein